MPEMNGDQMTSAIKDMSPHTPVLMVTGFADMPIDGIELTHQPDLILRKPITQTALRQAISRVAAAVPVPVEPNQSPVGAAQMERKLLW